jgi:hypothetical protein
MVTNVSDELGGMHKEIAVPQALERFEGRAGRAFPEERVRLESRPAAPLQDPFRRPAASASRSFTMIRSGLC